MAPNSNRGKTLLFLVLALSMASALAMPASFKEMQRPITSDALNADSSGKSKRKGAIRKKMRKVSLGQRLIYCLPKRQLRTQAWDSLYG